MKQLLTLLITIATLQICSAQNKQQITLIGHVVNKDNKPLKDANIIVPSTKKGTTTDNLGIFTLVIPAEKTTINISYTGYHTTQKEINTQQISQASNDTILLTVILEKKFEELSLFEIKAQASKLAYEKPEISIIDYDFYQNNLLLLLFHQREYKLRLVDVYSKTLLELPVRKKPESLFRDCSDNLHLLYTDSVYQLKIDSADISLMEPFSIQIYADYLLPCVADGIDGLFFRKYDDHNQSVTYYRVDKSTRNKSLIQRIVDDKNLTMVDNYYRNTMAKVGVAKHTMGDNTYIEQEFARKVEHDVWFYQVILNSPVYSPLIKTNDFIYIFNHMKDSAYIYDMNGVLKNMYHIDYHLRPGWKKELIVDYSKKELYTVCVKAGANYLLKIDPGNGKILNEYKLDYLFSDKIKIKNGVAYYLSNNRREMPAQNIFKQALN